MPCAYFFIFTQRDRYSSSSLQCLTSCDFFFFARSLTSHQTQILFASQRRGQEIKENYWFNYTTRVPWIFLHTAVPSANVWGSEKQTSKSRREKAGSRGGEKLGNSEERLTRWHPVIVMSLMQVTVLREIGTHWEDFDAALKCVWSSRKK